jgi:serine/threonine-protein phosphatase 6 regulatory ankyrin repeat subunit B
MALSIFRRIKPTGDNLVRYSQKGDLKAVSLIIQKGVHPDTKGFGVENALNKAIQNDHWEIVRLLVENGATIPAIAKGHVTLFHWAVSEGLYGYVVYLIEEGADINRCSDSGTNPLTTAAHNLRALTRNDQRFAIFRLLLNHPDLDLDVKLRSKRKGLLNIGVLEAALMSAASAGHVGAVGLLLEKGADPSFRAKTFETTAYRAAKERNQEEAMKLLKEASRTLFDAAESGNVERLQALIDSGAEVEQRTQNGFTPIMLAAQQNEVACIELLAAHGAHINARSEIGRTALDLASWHGCFEAVSLLLELGADVNAQTDTQSTALMFAAGNGHEAIVKLLLAHKADPTIKDYRGKTAAHRAADGRYQKILMHLEAQAPGIDVPDHDGETPLTVAASVCDLDMLNYLLSKRDKNESLDELAKALVGACMRDDDYDTTDEDSRNIVKAIIDFQPEVVAKSGSEALKAAMSFDHPKTAQLLIDHGVNIHEIDEKGYTMLMHAVDSRSPVSVALLVSLGVDQKYKNREGKTALDMAEEISKMAPKDGFPQKVLSLLTEK